MNKKELRSNSAQYILQEVFKETMSLIKLIPYNTVKPFCSIIRPLDVSDFVICRETGLELVKANVLEKRLGKEAHRQIMCQVMNQVTFN